MGERRNFPNNPLDFIKKYAFEDEKNGSVLVPLFRVEQMIEYYTKDNMSSDWIPVEDHLPNKRIYNCFVRMKRVEDTSSGSGYPAIMSWDEYEECWKWHNGKKLSNKFRVLAWQPVKYPIVYSVK